MATEEWRRRYVVSILTWQPVNSQQSTVSFLTRSWHWRTWPCCSSPRWSSRGRSCWWRCPGLQWQTGEARPGTLCAGSWGAAWRSWLASWTVMRRPAGGAGGSQMFSVCPSLLPLRAQLCQFVLFAFFPTNLVWKLSHFCLPNYTIQITMTFRTTVPRTHIVCYVTVGTSTLIPMSTLRPWVSLVLYCGIVRLWPMNVSQNYYLVGKQIFIEILYISKQTEAWQRRNSAVFLCRLNYNCISTKCSRTLGPVIEGLYQYFFLRNDPKITKIS